ncbi:hypothetical protein [Subtercola sp. YIM 133946]|uniref:hypothetical protein n=1 Tax=Subtercola sp. YIM 133946 TaxID=3118909 RepID=UPI002F937D99
MYNATSVREEPVDERFLDVILGDQDLADLAFWMIIQSEWPPVVKTGCTDDCRPAAWSAPETTREHPRAEHVTEIAPWMRSPPSAAGAR